ncbi:short chain oxidoreductase [Pluteus cervinus]|uniref:Short chain oxidoreductase n=1 Tax=Pluteus cervinus TaxID=181527 RepID=A0ACD3B0L7_9AGAR|nr:short chain oxidoreductase [Pluteus cervinus]
MPVLTSPSMFSNPQPKRVAIVTGAAQGIGRGVALRLSKDGLDVVLNDLSEKKHLLDELSKEIDDSGGRCIVAIADVSVEEEVRNMVQVTVEELGGLDVMVANAGIATMRPIIETQTEEWDHLFSVNTRGTFLCYKHAAQQMIKQGRGGRIIGASSSAGKQGEELCAAYSATKFAIRGLTHAAAKEWGKHGITVNAYAPGPIDTAMTRALAGPAWDELVGQPNVTPVGFIGQPEDVAAVISFLASKEARYITGTTLCVDGGRVFD